MRAGPLDGVRVADFTWVVAGPVCTRLLADLGAEVIRIEHPETAPVPDRRGGLAGSLGRGKQSIVVDLRRADGVMLARRLALAADVVVDNFSARVMEQLGLDHDTLSRDRADLITVRMTGFGLTGPDRDRVSYGPTLQALTGFTWMLGEPGTPFAGFGYSYSDLAAGNVAALAIVAALWRRRRTGRGACIDLAQQEVLASLLGPVLLERAADGGRSTAAGNASQEVRDAPHGVYPCAGDDRWIAIAVGQDAHWQALRAVMGEPAWARAPHLDDAAGRVRHAAELDAHLAAWTVGQQAESLMERLQGAGVPAGRVADARDLCARDPQLAARRHFADVATPEGRRVRIDGPPYRLSDTPAAVRGPGPLLGEHTDAILARVLGCDTAEIARLRAAAIVA